MTDPQNSKSIFDIMEVYRTIPTDFPKYEANSTLPGAQLKFGMVKFEEHFYTPGNSPPEIVRKWQACEDFAMQFRDACLTTKAGKRSHMPEEEILDQYLIRLIAADWVSKAEAAWIIGRAASLLGWPIPKSLSKPA